ncbi:MAG: hypothetical protein MJZ12_00215 [Prevotella sp.]|nr:hypothetical protein [Prevotella sp.]
MNKAINILLVLAFVGCMILGVMFYDWTHIRLGGIFVIPATWCVWTLMERNDNLPKWIK